MKNETEKTELKRALFIQGGFMLSDDSLNREVINPEFEVIDKDLNKIFRARPQPKPTAQENKIEELTKELLNGKKISLGC